MSDGERAQRFRECVKEGKAHSSEGKTPLQHLQGELREEAAATLSTDARRRPGWYEAAQVTLEPAIAKRNAAQTAYNSTPTADCKAMLKTSRKAVKQAVAAAEKAWTDEQSRIDI